MLKACNSAAITRKLTNIELDEWSETNTGLSLGGMRYAEITFKEQFILM
jgi:hypothetical protein